MYMYNQNVNKIGKIKSIDTNFGTGVIVDNETTYLFTLNDLKGNVESGDLVKFRAEIVNDQNRAFFVNKIDQNYEMKDNLFRGKKYIKEIDR